MIDLREELIQYIQRTLKRRYNKTIVEIKDPFQDMRRLLGAVPVKQIIDGGGYHGEIALQLLKAFPEARVYSFEPSKTSFDVLSQTAESHQQIKPVNRGLSSHGKEMTLYVNAQDSTNSLSPVGEGGKKYQSWQTVNVGSEEVELIALDQWVASEGVPGIDLIKLDLQGHELHALKGAEATLRSTVRLVYVEVEFLRVYKENCLMCEVEEYLRSVGFELFQLYNLTSGEDNRLVCGDAIFVRPDRIASLAKEGSP